MGSREFSISAPTGLHLCRDCHTGPVNPDSETPGEVLSIHRRGTEVISGQSGVPKASTLFCTCWGALGGTGRGQERCYTISSPDEATGETRPGKAVVAGGHRRRLLYRALSSPEDGKASVFRLPPPTGCEKVTEPL